MNLSQFLDTWRMQFTAAGNSLKSFSIFQLLVTVAMLPFMIAGFVAAVAVGIAFLAWGALKTSYAFGYKTLMESVQK